MKRIKERPTTLGLGIFITSLMSLLFPIAVFAGSPCPYVWNSNLKTGDTGMDVLKLQQFLNSDPDTVIALSGKGSVGQETEKFGGATRKAVIAFQQKYAAEILIPNGLTRGSGRVGDATRAKMNALCRPKVTSTTTGAVLGASTSTATDVLMVTDEDQIASSIAPQGAGVNFTSITLAAGDKDVTVRSISVSQAGRGQDSAFFSIALTGDHGLQIGNQARFNSNHKATFATPFTIPAMPSSSVLSAISNSTVRPAPVVPKSPSIDTSTV